MTALRSLVWAWRSRLRRWLQWRRRGLDDRPGEHDDDRCPDHDARPHRCRRGRRQRSRRTGAAGATQCPDQPRRSSRDRCAGPVLRRRIAQPAEVDQSLAGSSDGGLARTRSTRRFPKSLTVEQITFADGPPPTEAELVVCIVDSGDRLRTRRRHRMEATRSSTTRLCATAARTSMMKDDGLVEAASASRSVGELGRGDGVSRRRLIVLCSRWLSASVSVARRASVEAAATARVCQGLRQQVRFRQQRGLGHAGAGAAV